MFLNIVISIVEVNNIKTNIHKMKTIWHVSYTIRWNTRNISIQRKNINNDKSKSARLSNISNGLWTIQKMHRMFSEK